MDFFDAKSIVEIAKKRAKAHPERNYITFLKDGEQQVSSLSYQELDQSASQVAGWIQQQGVEPGERCFIILPNGIEFIQFAL